MAAPWEAYARTASWNGKSRVASRRPRVTYGEVTAVSAEYTSPNMKKSSRPRSAA